MKPQLSLLFFLILAVFGGALGGCAAQNDSGAISVLIPWPQADHSYAMTRIDLDTIEELGHLKGKAATLHAEPSGDMRASPLLVARFLRKSDGLHLAKDALTLRAATIYAHLEHLLQLDREVGIAQLGQWPLHVGIKTQFIDIRRRSEFNNASYDPLKNTLAFAPTDGGDLAVDFNAGVLGHEHFHALFHQIVGQRMWRAYGQTLHVQPIEDQLHLGISNQAACPQLDRLLLRFNDKTLPQVPADQYNYYFLRGINEGLADFWGWVYTNDPSYLNPSFVQGNLDFRILKNEPRPFIPMARLKRLVEVLTHMKVQDSCLSYEIGASVANLFYRMALASEDESFVQNGGIRRAQRIRLAQQLVEALPRLGEVLLKNFSVRALTPQEIMQPLVTVMAKSQRICDEVKKTDLATATPPLMCEIVSASGARP